MLKALLPLLLLIAATWLLTRPSEPSTALPSVLGRVI